MQSITKQTDAMLTNCPFHKSLPAIQTDIELPEGSLMECPSCGLAFSSCSQEQFENALSDHWNEAVNLDPPPASLKRLKQRRKKELAIAKKLLGKSENITLLDVGCRTGTIVSLFDSMGVKAQGIDPTTQPVNLGIQAGRDLKVGYLESAGYEPESFDIITMYEVIEHLPTPKIIFAEIEKLLKPGGILVIGTGNHHSWTARIKREKWDFYSLRGRGGHVCFYSPSALAKIAQKFQLSLAVPYSYSFKIFERHEAPLLIYKLTKLFTELFCFPAHLANRGHQMECFLIKKTESHE